MKEAYLHMQAANPGYKMEVHAYKVTSYNDRQNDATNESRYP